MGVAESDRHDGEDRVASASAAVYAHTLPPPAGHAAWELLPDHLEAVAAKAERFAEWFGAGAWGRTAGLWHDLGKYSPSFQRYLCETASLQTDDPHRRELRGTVQHAAAGAWYAAQQFGPTGRLLAYCIAGHHAGLPNTEQGDGGEQARSTLSHKLKHPSSDACEAVERVPRALLEQPPPTLPPLTIDRHDSRRSSFQLAFFTRMVFSCLVDADFLQTEAFMEPAQAARRCQRRNVSMTDLAQRLNEHLQQLRAKVDADSRVNHWRGEVLRACREAANEQPGVFSLTVPTGGGKTLSSLAFALRHASLHGMRRVVVGIPYTSIIEQNADVYRRAMGDWTEELVLEHHSNLEPEKDERESERRRLVAENWDAPIVVTTNVQLLESLFANRPGRCRKLHRLARSVIVLDEAQALPPNLLAPTLWALRELVDNYGCTLVLCTATQPALERREGFRIGFDKPRPILGPSQQVELFAALKRVEVQQGGTLSDDTLTDQLADQAQVLCIVNTRKQAADLFTALTAKLGETQVVERGGRKLARVGTCLHLSANMSPYHRTTVLRLIRHRLLKKRPCRVISTQLVEAGVDVDFPVVYREVAGLDSIAQAAGRCNREGRLDGHGKVIVFERDAPQHRLPPFVRQPIRHARQVLPDHADDPLSPEAQHQYFRLHYWHEGNQNGWDRPPGKGQGAEGVLDCFKRQGEYLQFRDAAERYRLIDNAQIPILVPYGRRGQARVKRLLSMAAPPDRTFYRGLQRLIVTVHEPAADRMLNDRILMPVEHAHGQLVLSNRDAYDRRLGLQGDVAGFDPEGLVG